jgi:hypothetical protein
MNPRLSLLWLPGEFHLVSVGRCDSVPGHLLFNNLQASNTSVSFHFVPIPGVSNFAHGVKLRFRICAGPSFNGPAFLFLREPNDAVQLHRLMEQLEI